MSEQLPLSSAEPPKEETPLGRADQKWESPEGKPLWGVLTNRWNLLEFLSRGLVVPSASIAKYYDDLLRLTPGRIPVVAAPVSDELVGGVTGDNADVIFPVFIQFEKHDESPPAIRMSDAVAVHFRSQRDLQEHSAREFENIPRELEARVSPELFGNGSQTLASIAELSKPSESRVEELERCSRWSAAVLLGAAAVARNADAATASAVACLLSGKKWGKPAGCAHLRAIQPLREGGHILSGRNLEQKLFASIARRLCAEGHPGDPVAFVQSVKDELDLDEKSARALDKIAAILDGDEEFQPFRGTGSPVAKALLITLLRKDPTKLLPWAAESANADPPTLLTTGVMMGLARGRHLLPTSMRVEEIDRALADVEFAAAMGTPWKQDVVTNTLESGDSTVHRVQAGAVRFDLAEPPPTLHERVAGADFNNPAVLSACLAIARANGWSSAIRTRIAKHRGFEVTSKNEIVLNGDAEITVELIPQEFTTAFTTHEATGPLEENLLRALSSAPQGDNS